MASWRGALLTPRVCLASARSDLTLDFLYRSLHSTIEVSSRSLTKKSVEGNKALQDESYMLSAWLENG